MISLWFLLMKIDTDKTSLVEYTKGEEVLNVLTHLAGLVIPVLITVECIPLCEGKPFPLLTAILYAIGTAFSFISSVIYHALPVGRSKKIMRMIDHCAVFFAVSGTVTGTVPAVFQKGSPVAAVLMLVVAWSSAVSGLFLTLFMFEKSKAVRMFLYIFAAVFSALLGSKTYLFLPPEAFFCLLSGGAVLILGCVFLRIGSKKRYIHAVFHVCIAVGLGIYYGGIYKFVYSML